METVRKRKKSPKLDMNPMVDLAFLLVTFFMLATTFKTEEPILMQLPKATTDVKMPESGIMTLSIAPDGRVFFDVDGKFSRASLLKYLGDKHGVSFTEKQSKTFSILSSFGLPIHQLSSYLQLSPSERKEIAQPGIPCTDEHNELADWIVYARVVNPRLRVAIKSDQNTPYLYVDRVIQTLKDNQVLRFNLITDRKIE